MAELLKLPPQIGAIALPSGPSFQTDDAREKQDEEILRWTDAALEEVEMDRSQDEHYKDVSIFLNYLAGKQWKRGKGSKASRATINRVVSLFWESVSLLTDLRQVGKVTSRHAQKEEWIEIGQKLNNALSSWWMKQDGDMQFTQMVCYAMLSTGYAKQQWNPALEGGLGDIELVPIGMDQIRALRPGAKFSQSEVIVYQDVRSLRWLRSRFKERAATVRPDTELAGLRAPTGSHGQSEMLSPFSQGLIAQTLRRITGKMMETARESVVPVAKYQEFWVQDDQVNELNYPVLVGRPGQPWAYIVAPGEKLYPRGRVIVRADKTILDGQPNPYLHGEFPFGELQLNRLPWETSGTSDMRPWVSMQNAVNQQVSAMLNTSAKSMNPLLVGPKNALDPGAWSQLDLSKPGEQVRYNPVLGQPPKIERPPGVPPSSMQLTSLLLNEMDRSSGLSAAQAMLSKKQVPAGDTLEKVKSVQTTPMRLKGRNIEVFMRHMAEQGIWNVCQFYNEKRQLMIGGPEEADLATIWDPAELNAPSDPKQKEEMRKLRESWEPALGKEQTDRMVQTEIWRTARSNMAKRFGFYIKPGSLLDLDRQTRGQVALVLRKNGDISRETLYKELGADIDPATETKKIIQEKVEEEKAMAAAGIQPQGAPRGRPKEKTK